MKLIKKIPLVYIVLFVAAIFMFYHLGDLQLLNVDEPRYAEAAREMLEKNDWLTPYFNYHLRFDKPILFYWLIAVSYIFLGVNEFAARFPSALMGLLTVLTTYFFASKVYSKKVAVFSALSLVTMLEFLFIARMSITDTTLAFFISAAIMFGYLGVESNKKIENASKETPIETIQSGSTPPSKNLNKDSLVEVMQSGSATAWWISYFCCALGFLTKGPIGLILPVAVIGVYLLLTGQVKKNLKIRYHLPGIIIFAVVALPWYVLIIQKHGMLYVNEFFLKHNLERFSSSSFHHQQPIWYFIPVVLIGAFPWTGYFLSAATSSLKELFGSLKQNLSNIKSIAFLENVKKDELKKIFPLLWFVFVFVFYSLSKAKLLTYILPVFPAAALMVGLLWNDFEKSYTSIKKSTVGFSVFCILIFIAAEVALTLPFVNEFMFVDKIVWQITVALIFGLIPALLWISVVKRKQIQSFTLIVLLMFSLLLVNIHLVNPILYNLMQKDLEDYTNLALRYKNSRIMTYRVTKPSLTFYKQEEVEILSNGGLVKEKLDEEIPTFIITKNRYLEEDKSLNIDKFYVKKGKRYALVTNIKE